MAGLLRRPRAAERLAHRIEAVATTLAAPTRREGEIGVFAHAPVDLGLQQIGRRRAQIELPAELDDVVEPLLLGGGADQDLVAGEPREPRVHLARDAVLDRDHVRQLGDARAQLRAHQVAAVRMAPQRDADVDLLADRAVVLVQRLVLLVQEMQHRRVHDDVVGADRLRVPGEIEDHVEVLVGARQDGAPAAQLLDRDVERALALGHRHREELALLAADEHAVDAEIVDPVAQVPAQAGLVDRRSGVNGVSAAAQMPLNARA